MIENVSQHIELLGKVARDRVTGAQGVVSSISFDLYGCIQAAVTPPVDKDGKHREGHWYDVNRLEVVVESRCMPVPKFAETPALHAHGPAEKPRR